MRKISCYCKCFVKITVGRHSRSEGWNQCFESISLHVKWPTMQSFLRFFSVLYPMGVLIKALFFLTPFVRTCKDKYSRLFLKSKSCRKKKWTRPQRRVAGITPLSSVLLSPLCDSFSAEKSPALSVQDSSNLWGMPAHNVPIFPSLIPATVKTDE